MVREVRVRAYCGEGSKSEGVLWQRRDVLQLRVVLGPSLAELVSHAQQSRDAESSAAVQGWTPERRSPPHETASASESMAHAASTQPFESRVGETTVAPRSNMQLHRVHVWDLGMFVV